ncbi:hypothetical protein T265_01612, partial [Opisthorchis viverrini]
EQTVPSTMDADCYAESPSCIRCFETWIGGFSVSTIRCDLFRKVTWRLRYTEFGYCSPIFTYKL